MSDALINFSGRWILDGDYIRCRRCNRPQIASYALWDFPHSATCASAGSSERNPWKSLAGLITSEISRAKPPEA